MYAAVPIAANDLPAFTAQARARRLNKGTNNWVLGITLDLLLGAGPWVYAVAIAAAVLTAIYKNADGAAATFLLFDAPVAVSAIATFASFLLVTCAPKPVTVVSVYHVSCPSALPTVAAPCALQTARRQPRQERKHHWRVSTRDQTEATL
jgi:hypothetical protein